MESFFDFIYRFVTKPDEVLIELVQSYNNWTYLFLFLIIFAETGLIVATFVMPFLPGDALLFAIGLISAKGVLNIWVIIPLLILAALLGDNLNYYVGRKFGNWIISNEKKFFLKASHIEKAKQFFDKNGKKAIIMARFIPVVRTIVPFLSGTTRIHYPSFFLFSLIGAFLWVGVITFLGYGLGNISFVADNLEYFIWLIILLANIPLIKQVLFRKKNTE